MFFWKWLRLPGDLVYGVPYSEPLELNKYADELRERLRIVHLVVRKRFNLASDRMKTEYELKANLYGFQAGDLVQLCNLQRKKGTLHSNEKDE